MKPLLLIICLGLFNQSTLSQPWPIKNFEVVAVEPAGYIDTERRYGPYVEFLFSELRDTGIVDPDFLGGLFDPIPIDSATIDSMESYFTQAAEKMESWGFPPPALEPIVIDRNGNPAYRIYVVGALENSGGFYNHNPCQNYVAGEMVIVLNAADMITESGAISAWGKMGLPHELFHAVQGSMPFFQGCGGVEGNLIAGHWIVEGQANAVGFHLADIIGGLHRSSMINDNFGVRRYSNRLPVDHKDPNQSHYKTSSFWQMFAEMSGGGEPSYQWLADIGQIEAAVRDCYSPSSPRSAPCRDELRWVNNALRSVFGGKRLRDLYPLFMYTYMFHERGQYVNLGGSLDSFDRRSFHSAVGCSPVYLENDPDFIELTEQVPEFDPVSAQCWRVHVSGFDEAKIPVAVSVIGPPTKRQLEQLVAIEVDQMGRIDTATVRDPLAGDVPRTVWLYDLDNNDSTNFLIANVAHDPGATTPLPGLEVTFTVLDEFAYNVDSEGGGPTPAEIDSPLGLEFDRIRRRVVMKRPDNADVCRLDFQFSSTETGDAFGILMDHTGPIEPGDYDIFNPSDTGFDFDYMEDNPGVFTVLYGFGPNSPLTNEYTFGYTGKGGTVTLTKVSPERVIGTARVAGDRTTCLDPNGSRSIIGNMFTCPGPPTLTASYKFSVRPTGAVPSGRPSAACFKTPTPGSRSGIRRPPPEGPGDDEDPVIIPPPPPPPPPADDEGEPPGAEEPGEEQPQDDDRPADNPTDPLDAEGDEISGTENYLSLTVTGDVDSTYSYSGSEITLSGGCDGSSTLSIGFHKGLTTNDSWFNFAFDTADIIGTGDTGIYTIQELLWDNGATVPANSGVGVPDRFTTGQGSLTITRHVAETNERRMNGTARGEIMQNSSGATVNVQAEFGVNLSCGISR